jgi:integrase
MASLYQRPGTVFWWIKYRDPSTRKIIRETTLYRHGIGGDTRKARELEAQRTLAERSSAGNGKRGAFAQWVKPWLDHPARLSDRTRTRYLECWKMLRLFLDERKVFYPVQLTRAHCFDYLTWRAEHKATQGKYRAGRNTALLELKLLGMIMKEAVHRGHAPANPARELGLKRAPRKLKPELSDADYDYILAHIELEAEPNRTRLKRSLLVARYQGARLNETNVNPMRDVELWQEGETPRGSIRLHQKGGKVRVKPLHPRLIPLFAELRAAHAQHTYPPGMAANLWTKFLERCGLKARLPNVCFHCTRVTVETRLLRARVDKAVRMEYLSHDAGDVNDSYNRFTLEDLRQCHAALG